MFGLGKAQEKIVSVADVGGESAGVAIAAISREGPARIIASERSSLPMEKRTLDASAVGVIAELGKAAAKALSVYAAKQEGRERAIAESYAIIRSPWSNSKTIHAETKAPEDRRVDKRLISALAEEAVRGDTEFAHAKTLEASVVRVELNGDATAHPEGKLANRIAASALLSDCEPKIRFGVSQTMMKVFGTPPPSLRSGVRALIAVLVENELLRKDCLIVAMSSHTTSLIVIRKGTVAEIYHVPEGSWTIVKRIAREKMPEEVMSLIRLLALDQCEGGACEDIQAALAKAEPELVKSFGEGLVKLSASRRVPNTLILLVPDDLSPWLLQFFSRIDFGQFTTTTRPLA